ncbi:hypothetical protein PM082_023460 [Marasmius tenuissimus]|nr:hypothetical protein PM082_023460 [Marasmius tenuissimus]
MLKQTMEAIRRYARVIATFPPDVQRVARDSYAASQRPYSSSLLVLLSLHTSSPRLSRTAFLRTGRLHHRLQIQKLTSQMGEEQPSVIGFGSPSTPVGMSEEEDLEDQDKARRRGISNV